MTKVRKAIWIMAILIVLFILFLIFGEYEMPPESAFCVPSADLPFWYVLIFIPSAYVLGFTGYAIHNRKNPYIRDLSIAMVEFFAIVLCTIALTMLACT